MVVGGSGGESLCVVVVVVSVAWRGWRFGLVVCVYRCGGCVCAEDCVSVGSGVGTHEPSQGSWARIRESAERQRGLLGLQRKESTIVSGRLGVRDRV